MRKFILLSLVFLTSFTAFSQDFSNKGKDFWVGYGYHTIMQPANGNLQEMVLYFATDQVTNITISIPSTGYTQNITTPAGNNVTTSFAIPKAGAQDARLFTEGTSSNGIHITSDKPMVAYAHIYNGNCSGATILYPTNTLGKEYYSINYKNWSNQNNANCWFYVVATDTGTTTVEITPQADQAGVVTTGGWVAGTTYTVTLTQGQIYNVMGVLTGGGPPPGNNPFKGVDLTGSKVKSINTGNGCKRIGVFSGSGRISITCNANSSSSDNYMVQAAPKTAWGKKYLTTPALGVIDATHPEGNQAVNIFRVCVADPLTVVRVNGVITVLPLQNNFYYEIPQTNLPQMIEADQPIMVAQYFTSSGSCGNGAPGDPEVIYLSAVEQNINTVLWNATPNFAIGAHYFNVVIPNGGTALSSFTLDGIPWGGFVTHPQDPNYSYLRLAVGGGPRIIRSDSGFNAIAYGFGNFESYGYNAGTNIKDLYQQIGVSTTYGIETSPSVCTNSPFKFKVSLPYCADSMQWNLTGLPGPPAAPPTLIYSTCTPGPGGPDSTTVVNGKTIYWYSLPTPYSFSTAGSFPVTITTYNSANPDGCGNAQDIDFDLVVSDPPIADFTWTPGGCVAESYKFLETTPQTPKPTYSFYWNFGDPGSGANNTSNVRNPSHTFSAPGTYTVKYVAITTPGCFTDTVTKTVIVDSLPRGTISGTVAVCQNSAPDPIITFTGINGTLPYTFYYNINGGPALSVATVAPSATATITAPTTVAGVFVYTLDSVKNTGSTLCVQSITGQQTTITVNPLPTASISGTTSVCQDAPSPNVTFTGAAGTAPYTFSYTINGGPVLTVTTIAGNSVTVAAPTNVVGTFTYSLVSVQDGSSTTCSQTQSGSTIITVNPLPTALISGTTAVCLNAASPLITFTGAGATAPYTFTYSINGGPNQTVTTIVGNSVTVAAPTNIAGVFTYALVSVQDGSSTLCSQAQSGSAVITVNPLPTAAISGTTTVCLNAPMPNITFTGAAGTAPYTFSYTINGGPVLTVSTVAGNSVTVAVPTNIAGTFTYDLVSVLDGSSTLCSQAQTGSAVVTVNALPTATIAGTTAVCLNAASPNITFTGAVGTAPYTFSYTINGGPVLTVTTIVGNSVTVAVPTNVVGTFTYTLTAVQEGSANTCSQAQSGSAIITVNPLPTATISGTTAVCLNAPSPLITFTGAGATAPYTFTYTINGGPNQTVTTIVGNSVTVAVPTNVAGTFTYALVSVQDGSSTTCSQAQAGSAIVIVHPLPTPNFTFTIPSCETGTITFTDGSVANAGTLTGWSWNFGDPGSGPFNTSILQNPTHTFATAGTYTVTLSVTTNNGCVSLPVASIPVTINARPQAGFIIPEVCLSDTYAQFIDTSKLALPGILDRWDWNFGDPGSGPLNTSTLQNPTHSYTAVGNYNVRLIVWNNAIGCRDTITQLLTVNGSFPVANFTVQNPTTLCANDSVAIVDQSTVFPGVITKVEIYWDNIGQPGVFDIDNSPFFGKVYKHLYPNFQAPLTRNFSIRFRAFSGGVCVNEIIQVITVNAAPLVQFNAMPDTCLLIAPFQITQATEIGGVPGTGVFSGPGITPGGIFSPAIAGIGVHTIMYTFTSTVGGCVDTMSNTIRVLDTAHAFFTNITPICEGVGASFTDASTAPAGIILSNTVWDFGDGTPLENHAPGSTFTHVFANPGTYVVQMYNVTTVGCNSTVFAKSVTVDPNHSITLTTANNIQTRCINNAIVDITYNLGGGATGATVTGLPPGVTYAIAGTVLTITGAPNTTVGSPFNYNIQTTGNTCTVANATGRITVEPDHTITIEPGSVKDQSVCVNTAITPIVYILGGGANNVTVTGLPAGVNYIVAGNIVTISGIPTTTLPTPLFSYSIVTTGNTCLVANASGTIKVNPYPVPMFAVDKPSYCIPNAVVKFNNSSTVADGSSMTYSWDFGEPLSAPNNTSTSPSPTHWYSGIGPFDVTLSVRSGVALTPSGFGCVHDTIIKVTNIHPQPKADFSINKPSVCIGDDVTFTDLSDGKDGTINQWNWDLGDGSIRNTNTVTYTYTDTITFNVILYTINTPHGCNSDTITKQFTVYPYPHVNAGPDRKILEGGQITLESVTFANDPQYLWTPNLYLVNNKVARPVVIKPLTDMTYTLTVTARGGCARSDDVFVKLLKFPVIPNTFTPNNDGKNDTWRIDYLNTYLNNRVQVFTRTGQLVFESRGYNTPWDGTLKGKPLPFDTYYYIIEPGNGRDPITGYVTIIK